MFPFLSALGPDIMSKAFSNTMPTGRVTNPNAKKLGKGKTAKSKRRRMREAQMQMQQPQMSFAEQQQLQNDQFKFLQDNIFGRTGATRRTIGGQLEQDVPQGMDFFKNTGPDRQSVKDRQARLDSTSLNQPGVWNQAQQAVNDTKRAQGWSDPNTPPASPPGPSMYQMLRRDNGAVGYFNDPAYNSINPRTGLVTNDGPFNLSRDTPYGSARSYFEGSKGNISKEPATVGEVTVGPVQQLFEPQQNMTPPSPMWNMQPQQPSPFDVPQGQAQPQSQRPAYTLPPGSEMLDAAQQWWQGLFNSPAQKQNMQDLSKQYTSGDRFMGL
jgi:hypothetical protein